MDKIIEIILEIFVLIMMTIPIWLPIVIIVSIVRAVRKSNKDFQTFAGNVQPTKLPIVSNTFYSKDNDLGRPTYDKAAFLPRDSSGNVISVSQNNPVAQPDYNQLEAQPSATFDPIITLGNVPQIVDKMITDELLVNNCPEGVTVPYIEKRKKVLTIIFSVVTFFIICLYFFHFNITWILLLIELLNIIMYIVFMKRFDIHDYLRKQVIARPDEKISNICAAFVQEAYVPHNKSFNIICVLVALVLPLLIFNHPYTFYEKTSEGYYVRFHTIGLVGNDKVVIPKEYNGENVVGIRGNVFANIRSLKEVELPETVKVIRGKAFMNDKNLVKINLPSGLEYLGGSAFKNCESLSSIAIPKGINEINGNTFEGCSSLKSVELPETITSIHGSAFKDCTSLTSIKIPDDVTKIGGHAFEGCSQLKEVQFNSELTIIEGYAFASCNSLTQVDLPSKLESIGGGAFANSGLTSITIPESVVEIHGEAFMNCYSLETVNLPSKITEIRGNTFQNCSKLRSIDIPYGVTRIGGHAFHSCSSLELVTVPDTVVEIGSSAFRECYSLKEITIPRDTYVNERAFKESPTVITRK